MRAKRPHIGNRNDKINQPRPLNKNTSVVFATFSLHIRGRRLSNNGNVEPLRDFLISRIKRFVLIEQPLPGSDYVMPKIAVYEHNRLAKLTRSSWWLYILYPLLSLTNANGTQVSFKIRDFLAVLDWCLREKSKIDYMIGMESINTLAGIILRKFNIVRKVVYYEFDYSPKRYTQSWFNWIYLQLDKFCATHADYIWEVSKAMHTARIDAGFTPHKSASVIHVPIGLYPQQIKNVPEHMNRMFKLVYMGTLGTDNGPELAIESIPIIARKFPSVCLYIIGDDNNNLVRLTAIVRSLKIERNVKFMGLMTNREEIATLMSRMYIALAPYRAISGSPRYYADSSKIRAYFGAGLPVITTAVPPLGIEAAKKGAALIVKDDAQDIAQAVIKLFTNHKRYSDMRNKAVEFAKDNTFEKGFTRAFSQMTL